MEGCVPLAGAPHPAQYELIGSSWRKRLLQPFQGSNVSFRIINEMQFCLAWKGARHIWILVSQSDVIIPL